MLGDTYMNAFKRIKNNRLLQLLGALFMTLNLVAVVIGSISCAYAVGEVKKVIEEYNEASIDNVRAVMDMRLASGEKLAQDIFMSVNLSNLTGNLKNETPENRVLATKIIDTISYGVDTNNIINNAFVYFGGNDTIISTQGYFSAEFYFDNYNTQTDITFEEWKKTLVAESEPIYIGNTLKFSSYSRDLLEYRRPFKMQSRNLQGCVVVQYDNQEIIDILNRNKILCDASVQIRYVPTNSYLIQVGKNEVNNFMRTFKKELGVNTISDTPFGKMIVIKHTSVNRDWEYISAIPTDVFYHRTNTMLIIMMTIVCLQCALCAVLAYLFSARSYRPIQKMTDKIRQLAKDIDPSENTDDIDYIQNITSTAIGAYGEAKKQLETVRPMVAKSFLVQLLHGNNSERLYADRHLGETLNLFSKEGFVCIVILIEECTAFVSNESIEEMQLVKLAVSNIAEEMFEEEINAVALDYDLENVVMLLNMDYTENTQEIDRVFKAIDTLLKECQAIFEDKFKIYTSIGLSRLQEGVSSIYSCHMQAESALSQKMASGLYSVNYYHDQVAAKNTYLYSIDDEVVLINSAKTGDFKKVKAILDNIAHANNAVFIGGNLQVAQCFVVDMASTLMRLTNEVNAPEEVLLFNMSSLLALPSYPKMIDEIYRCYEILCEWMHKNKKSHNTQTKERVESYIVEHYLDNSLSLVGVADHLGLNPTYLSAFVKEQFGETFLNYVLQLRMDKAKEFLRTSDMSLQEIATKIGYANSGVFIRAFKKKFGHTPGVYRFDDNF